MNLAEVLSGLSTHARAGLPILLDPGAKRVVLNAGMKPSAYTDHLLGVVRGLRARGRVGAAAVAMARGSAIGARVKAVLDVSRRRGTTRTAVVAALAVAVAILLPVSTLHPVARAQEADGETFGTRSSLGDALPGSVAARDVTGRVLKPDGTPAVGAVVFRSRYSSHRPDWCGFGKGVPVDPNGEFLLKDMADDRGADLRDGIIARLPGYGLVGADPYRIEGQSSGIDLRLPDEATLRGVVVDQKGTHVSGASVTVDFVLYGYTEYSRLTVYASTAMPGWTATTNEDGQFAIGWLPKTPVCKATLVVRHKDFAATVQDVRMGGDAKTPKIVLKPGGAIEGRVVHESTDRPARGIRLSVRTGEARTDEAGLYRFPNLPAGKCYIRIHRPRDAPWTTKRRNAVTVSPNKTPRAPDIVLVKGGVLSGRVVDSRTKEALPRVCVVASNESGWTSADGSFRIRCLPGDHGLRYFHLPKDYLWYEHKTAGPFTVSPGETIEGIEIEVPRGLTIAGKVVDAQGAPLPKAKVTCRAKSARLRGGLRPEIIEYTDVNGTFRFRGLPPKTPVILAVRDRERRLAGALELASAEEAPATVTVKAAPLATVTGRVVHGDGGPFPGAGVCAPRTMSRAMCTRTDGTYELTVTPDTEVRLAACMTGYAMRSGRLPTVTLSPGERRTVEDLVLVRIIQLSGRVLDPTGEPVPRAKVEISPDPEDLDLTAEADEGGRFVFREVVPRTPRFAIRCRAVGRGLAGYTFIEHGQQQVELLLAEAVAMTGRVINGEGEAVAGARATAYIRLEGAHPRESGTATTDEHGKYRIEDVIPECEVSVSVEKGGYMGAGAEWVRVASSSVVETHDLVMLKGDSFIAGRVTDLVGDPLPRVHVSFTVPGAGSKFGQTDADGRYRIDCAPSGRPLLVRTYSWGHRPAVMRDVMAGSTNVDFLLEPKE